MCLIEEQQLDNLPLKGKDIKEATEQDQILSQVFNYTLHGWPNEANSMPKNLLPYFHKWTQLTLRNGCLMWGLRVVIPRSIGKQY